MEKKYEYKFSIVMAIYNVEKYLEEAIESVINQNIGFEENVQLILVNDGSPDNSEEICLKYKHQYPDNIIYIYQKNKGQSGARNAGLNKIKGKYTNFLDPDDKLSTNTLTEVFNFFERNFLYVDMVSIPLYYFEAQIGIHGKYKFMGGRNRIISLTTEPHNFVLSSASSFYKSNIIKDKKFDVTMVSSEDGKFNSELYLNNKNIGYVCENNVKYHYRKRKEQTSIVDNLKLLEKGYCSVLNLFEVFNKQNLENYQKEIIIYELRSRLRDIQLELFENKANYDMIIRKYKEYINLLSDDYIYNKSKWLPNIEQKLVFINLKNSNYQKLLENNIVVLNNRDIKIKNYYFKEKTITFEILFNNYLCNYIDIAAYDGNNKVYTYTKREDFNSPYDTNYGEFLIDNTHYRKFEFDINKSKIIKFMLINTKENKNYPIRRIIVDANTKLSLKDDKILLRHKKYYLSFNGRKFKLSKTDMRTNTYNFNSFFNIIRKYKYKTFLRLLSKRTKEFILINDRPDKAGDNGEALFKYIYSNRLDIAKNTYFVINKNSTDYKRLRKIGKVVKRGSIKHKFLFLNTKFLYTSHMHRLFYNAFQLDKIKYYQDLFSYKLIWLQHGIIKDDLSIPSNKLNIKADKFIVSTVGEYNEINQKKYFFDSSDILLTGLARFDSLENHSENIISLCPTWRKKLSGKILENGAHETLPDFDKSEYYINYKKLLTDKNLKRMLKKYKYTMNFILHPGMDGYKSFFDEFSDENIRIISQNDVSYSQVFSESKLLITDYSSVFFDFAYLKKPEIFFQFDNDTFFEEHYSKGYFLYENDAFGDVLTDYKDVVAKIKFYFDNGFKMEEKYIKRVNNTFKYTDKNNCKRIIDATYKK